MECVSKAGLISLLIDLTNNKVGKAIPISGTKMIFCDRREELYVFI